MYAIVDIETTGGHAIANGITEIAICIHDGTKVIEKYSTLINPRREIPFHITTLTGISNEMVKNAPFIEEVAADIYKMLKGKIFVAHNVNFDYSFVRFHLAACGYTLQNAKLCTLRLSRKIIPGYPSYSLGKLCHQLGIENNARHRAMGDAEATAILFSLLIQKDKDKYITKALKQNSKEQVLPPNLPKQDIEQLPNKPGIYYFHDQHGKVIYVGKAKSLYKRVCSHFSGNNPGPQRQEFLKNIYQISYQLCGTELVAFVLEAIEIKRLWPKYNQALKRFEHAYGIYTFEDQRGFLRMAIDKQHKAMNAIYTCNSLAEGRNLLLQLIDAFELCPKLCFIQTNTGACTGPNKDQCACEGFETTEAYNTKVNRAIEKLNEALPTYAIRDAGRTDNEHSCLLIEKGKFYGLGFISSYLDANNLVHLKPHLTAYPGNDYIKSIIAGYATKFPDRKVQLS